MILMGRQGFSAALAAAEAAEVVVLGLGGTSCGSWGAGRWGKRDNAPRHLHCRPANGTNGMQWAEGEAHDRTSIDLPGEQHALAAAVLALNKPTVLFLLNQRHGVRGGGAAPRDQPAGIFPQRLVRPKSASARASPPSAPG